MRNELGPGSFEDIYEADSLVMSETALERRRTQNWWDYAANVPTKPDSTQSDLDPVEEETPTPALVGNINNILKAVKNSSFLDGSVFDHLDAGVAISLRDGTVTFPSTDFYFIASSLNADGTIHDDTIAGNDKDNVLSGRDGNDIL